MSATEITTMTMSEAVEKFLSEAEADVEHGTLRANTVREYKRVLPLVLNVETAAGWKLGDLAYTEVGLPEVRAALFAYGKQVGKPRAGLKLADGTRRMSTPKRPAPTTIAGTKAALGSLFRTFDTALGINRPSPVRGLRMRDVTGGKAIKSTRAKRYLTLDEQARLVEHITGAHELMVRLILLTGLRSAEVRGLLWEDVVLDGAVPLLRVTGQADEHGNRLPRTKSETSRRSVPLVPEAVAVLREQRDRVEALHGRSEFVFPTSTNSEKTSNGSNLWRSVQIAARRAGIVGALSVHDLRHSFAKAALHRGVPLDVLSQVLGHADPSITASVYLAAEVSDADKLAALIRGTQLPTEERGAP